MENRIGEVFLKPLIAEICVKNITEKYTKR